MVLSPFILEFMKILSLDISSATIGAAILEKDEVTQDFKQVKLIYLTHFNPPAKVSLFQMLMEVKIFIKDLLSTFNPDIIVIEDILQFVKGKSGAKTIIKLAIVNRTVGLTIVEQTGKAPKLMNISRIRHAIKLGKIPPAKEDIPELVAQHLGISFPWIYKIRKGVSVPCKENWDMGDAIAAGLAWIKKGESVKKVKRRVQKTTG